MTYEFPLLLRQNTPFSPPICAGANNRGQAYYDGLCCLPSEEPCTAPSGAFIHFGTICHTITVSCSGTRILTTCFFNVVGCSRDNLGVRAVIPPPAISRDGRGEDLA